MKKASQIFGIALHFVNPLISTLLYGYTLFKKILDNKSSSIFIIEKNTSFFT